MQYLGHQSQDEALRLQSEGPGRLPGGGGEDRLSRVGGLEDKLRE